MQEVINRLAMLRTISGNAQIDYLELHKDDLLLREVLEYTYDSHKKFKIDVGKYINTPSGGYNPNAHRYLEQDDWDIYKVMLDVLSEKRSAKDSDVEEIAKFISVFVESNSQFLLHVLYKDLRLNMNTKKIQKVWGDFLVEPQVQLAQADEGKEFELGFYSRKFDGKRMYLKEGIAYSRSNNPCKSEPIQHILDQLKGFEDVILDGEAIYVDEFGNEDFQKAISLTSRDERAPECSNIKFVVFDIIPKQLFLEKKPWVPFHSECIEMRSRLRIKDVDGSVIETGYYRTEYDNVLVAFQTTDMSLLEEPMVRKNWEGLMYRNGNQPYEYKRTSNLLKIKKMQDAEFEIQDLEIGAGKHSGRLGKLNVVLPTGEQVGVGSGFDDKQRDTFWAKKALIESEDFKQKYSVKVKYFETTKDKTGANSLRFPIFLGFRDKTTGEEVVYLDD